MFSNVNVAQHVPKPLPSLSRDDEKLPPPPPSPSADAFAAPPPPPKHFTDDASLSPNPHDGSLSPTSPSPSDPRSFPSAISMSSAPPSPSADVKPKRPNPLIDLIETEKTYVDLLSGIIRKVASAWSRQNLPPPELDSMFRGIEGVYKANRALLAKLKEIGTNPSSPRPLGDLLMRWIDDLDTPYTTYCSKFLGGFDTWEPVQSNSRLLTVLATFSASNPPPLSALSAPHPAEPPLWTLDTLFFLPRGRIKYYQKLYGRLLKNKNPGRSSDRMLTEAVQTLERLATLIDERVNLRPANSESNEIESHDEVVIDTRVQNPMTRESDQTVRLPQQEPGRASIVSSTQSSGHSSGERASQDTTATSIARGSSATLSSPLSDLEWRLATDRCLDLFTMKPRAVRLVMNPPSLPFTRMLRFSMDVNIHFTPRSTGVEIVHRHAHIYLLTDLFLICERFPQEELVRDGPDMWLCYPPLAGKHLRVAPVEGSDNMVLITILKKETMVLHAESSKHRDLMMKEFQACIDLALSLPPPSKEPAPPVPTLNGLPRSPSAPLSLDRLDPIATHNLPSLSTSKSANVSPSASSPRSDPYRQSPLPLDPQFSQPLPNSMSPSLTKMAIPPEAQMQSVAPRLPSIHDSNSGQGQLPLRTSSTAESVPGPPSYSPGQTIQRGPNGAFGSTPGPPERQGSMQNGPSSFFPGQIIPPPRGESGRSPPPTDMGLPSRSAQGDSTPSFSPGQVISVPRGESLKLSPLNGMNGMGLPPRPGQGDGPLSSPQGQSMPPPRGESARSPPPNAMNAVSPHPQRPPGTGVLAHGPSGIPFGPDSGSDSMPGRQTGSAPPSQGPPYLSGHPAPFAGPSGRSPSDPSYQGGLRKSSSSRSLSSQFEQQYGQQPRTAPPVPSLPGGYPPTNQFSPASRTDSFSSLQAPHLRPMLPSAAFGPRATSSAPSSSYAQSYVEPSPPNSPIEEQVHTGPITNTVCATMKCKVFLQQQHAQWKSLGSAKLTLFEQQPINTKQLVVEADNKDKTMLISTIVLTDGVERVGKTGVAIELSDKGARTGIVYMIQLRNEKSAGGLFDSLLAGSDRAAVRH